MLDGSDGGGKSTQAPRLVEHLRTSGFERCRHFREPGGTTVGEKVRAILLDPSLAEMERATETFLYLAARAELVSKEVAPALARGEAVVCERFLLATLVYQGVAGGADPALIRDCFRPAALGVEPDLTIVLDVPPEVGLRRREGGKDRLEARDVEFHRRVRKGYADAVRDDPLRVRCVDAGGAPDVVFDAIRREVDDVLRQRHRPH